MLVYTSIYWYILVYTSIYCAFRHKDFFEISKWIQHGTRQDNKVQESPGSMCWYMLVYTSIGWYIPACTVLSGISLKSPCTALYSSGYNTVQGLTRPDKEMPQSHQGTCMFVFVCIFEHIQTT
jgi:hypothetical protein